MTSLRRSLLALALVSPTWLAAQSVLYWDTNGGFTGATNNAFEGEAPGLWDNGATDNWNSNPDGTWATQGWAQGSIAVFSAGTNADGYSEYEVDLGPDVDVIEIRMEEGDVKLYGGNYNGSIYNLSTVDIGSQSSLRIDVALYENNGPVNFVKTGAGSLFLNTPGIHVHTTGSSTFSGGFNFVYDFTGLSSGDITVNNGALLQTNGILDVNNRTVTITGTNSRITNAGHLDLGDSGNATLNLSAGGYFTVADFIALGLVNGVTGTATLDGSGTWLSAGTDLYLGYGGIGNLTVSNNSLVSVGGIAYLGYQGSGVGNLNLNSGGTLSIGGTNGIRKGSGSANITMNGGGLLINGSNLTTSVPITLTSGSISNINTNGLAATLSGTFSGGGGLAKSGTGDLYLDGVTNGTTFESFVFNAGTVYLNGAAPTIGTAVFNGGTFANGSVDNASAFEVQTGSLSATLGGSAGLTKTGSGNFTLSGTNTYTGGTTVSAGRLYISSDANLGASTGSLAIGADAILDSTGYNFITNRAVTVDGSNAQLYTDSNLIIGNSAASSLTVSNNALASTYDLHIGYGSGGVGTVNIGSGGAVSVGNVTTLGTSFGSAGTLNLNSGGTLTTAGLAVGAGSGTFNFAGGTLRSGGAFSSSVPASLTNASTVDTNGFATTLSGALSGSGSLTKAGSGTLTLSGSNSYTGGTTVNAGTLSVSSATSLGSGALIVNGGTLAGSANLSLNQTVTVDSADATLTSTGYLEIGSIGNGSLIVSDGAQVTSGGTTAFAVDYDTVGTGMITGTNSRLDSTSTLFLGYHGAGTLTVGDGGTVAASTISVATGSGSGILNLNDGGTVATGDIDTNGSSQLNLAGGTLQVTGDAFNTAIATSLATSTSSTFNTNGHDATHSGAISGAGALTKTGTGNLTLSGTNAYTGGTTISAGTLTGNASSLQGNIVNHTTVTFDQTSAGTYAGNMSGSGSLTKIGAGNLTLSGTNSYAGGTTVSAGTLTGDSSSLQGSITNNATVVFDQASTDTYAGVVSGSGSLTKAGAGNLTLSGTQSYAGGTTVSAGILTLGHATDTLADAGSVNVSGGILALGSHSETVGAVTLASGSITGTGTLTGTSYSLTDSGTISVNLAGDAPLTKSGAGNAILSGTNTYTGGTTVSAGTLTGNTSSLPGDITNNAAVVFDQTATGTYAGIVSGTGSLTKSGAGTLTLSGAHTYAGGTTVSAGTLTGNTTSLQGDIANNATLVFDQATTGTYAGNLSGTGSLTKSGVGILTLSGTNTYAGGTTVSAGTLAIASDAKLGDSSGALAVTSGATLNTGGDFRTNRAVTVDGSGSTLYNNGELIIGNNGTGSLALTNSATASAYNLTLAYTGGTGTVDISSGSSLTVGNVTSLDTATSTLNLNTGGTLTTAGISGSGTFNLAGGTLRSGAAFSSSLAAALSNASTVDTNGFATTLSGNLSGTGSLTKTGSGTLTLSGTNTYSGGTTVSGGTLTIAADAKLGDSSSALAVTSGATLDTGGDFRTNRAVTVDGSGSTLYNNGELIIGNNGTGSLTLTDGASASTYNLTLAFGGGTGSVDIGSGSSVTVGNVTALGSASSSVTLNTGGTLTTAGLSGSGTFNLAGGTLRSGAALSSSLAADLSNASTVDTNGHATTLSGNLSGTGSLTKSGAGTLTLSGTNAYTGGTTISAGTLTGNTASLQGNIVNNSAVIFDQATTATYAGAMSGSGSLTKSGAGNLTLSGTNSYTGGTTVSAGTLTGNASSLQGNIVNNSAVIFDQAITGTYAGALSGSGSLSKSGVGNLTLSGANSYTGGTTISAGTLTGNTSSLQGSITNNAAVVFDQSDAGTYTSAISGSGSLTKSGAGNLSLSGANTYSGGTTVSAGTLSLGAGGTSGSVAGDITNNSALVFNRSDDTTYTGVVSGSGSLTQDGYILRFSEAQTYTGATSVKSGGYLVLSTSADQGLSASTTVDLESSAVLDFSNRSLTVAGLTGAGRVYSFGGSNGHLTVDTAAGQDQTFSGQLGQGAPDFAFTKTGDGSLALAGTNTHTGATTVSGGTLVAASSTALGSTSAGTTIASGATLTLANDISLGTEAIASSGTVTNTSGTNSYAGVLSGTGNLTVTGGSLSLTGANTYSGSTIISAGSLTGNTTSLPGNITNNATLVFDQASAGTYTGIVSGSGSLTKTGAGTLTLSGANTYSGGTTVSAGTLQGDTTSLVGNIANNATLVFDQATTGTYAGNLSGTGSLTKSGVGTLTLSGANTYAGDTTIAAGTLSVSSASALGTSNVMISGGTLASSSTLSLDRTVTVDGSGSVLTTASYAEVGSTGTGSLTVSDGGSTAITSSLALGVLADADGTVTVNGTDSSLTVGGIVYLGYFGASTLAIADGGAATFNNRLAMAEQAGASGTITVTGSNSILDIDSTLTVATFGTGEVSVGSGGTLTAGKLDLTAGGGSAGTFNLNSGGTLRVGGTNGIATGSGSATFNAQGGTLQVADHLTTSAPLTLVDGTTSTVNTNGFNATLSGVFAGDGALTKSGTGILTLSGNNTFTGGTTVSGGTLAITSAGNLGTGDLTVNGGTLSGTGSFVFNNDTVVTGASSSLTTSSYVEWGTAGNGSLTIADGGTVTSGSSTAFGHNGGDVATATVTGAGSSLVSTGDLYVGINGNGTLTIENGGLVSAPRVNIGVFGGSSGTLNLNVGGTLRTGGSDGIASAADTATINFNGGTLDIINSNFDTVDTITLGTGTTSTIDTNTFGATFAGAIAGNGGFTKDGSGTLLLTTANTYTGSTTITTGTLALGADGTIAASSGVDLGTAGILDLTAKSSGFAFGASQTLSGAGTINLASDQTLDFAGTLAPGNSPGIITVDGNLVLNSAAVIAMELAGAGGVAGTDFDQILVTGDLTLGGTLQLTLLNGYLPSIGQTFQLFDAANISGIFASYDLPTLSGATWDTSLLGSTGILGVSAVPEPSTYALIVGLTLLFFTYLRRRAPVSRNS